MTENPNPTPSSAALTVAAIADLVGGRWKGDANLEVLALEPVDEAGPRDMAFLAARRYAQHVPDCAAAAYLVSEEMEKHLPEDATRVVVSDPYPAMRTLLQVLHPPTAWTAGVHPTAILGSDVGVGVGVEIGPYAVLGDGVCVGDGSRIGAHCVISRGSVIGAGCRLYPHVVLYEETTLGDRVIVHAGARLGSDGFGYTLIDGEHMKMPQVGRCIIDDDVEIGANSTIDRGSLGDTRIGHGVKLDNLVHVAHNVHIGARSLLAALVGIAGSTRIGRGVWFGGQSGAINQLEIGDGAQVTVQTGVTRDLAPGETVSGIPSRPHREYLRTQAQISRLPKLVERVQRLELDRSHDSDG
ncbi:MAG: UDP-3-O-(3-hydroxymyristoyl)glucosamine N-acyltransferase [Gemmatimonadota bacterium]|nr:UDP-3-O-(3-hydroxymyristoyl)glucosamine N-acyltransferase [Gemmatimonadota bacterium]